MDAIRRGLIGRRVCGCIEVGFGILFLIGAFHSRNFLPILCGVFIVQTGLMGTVSKTRELVLVYLVTGVISAVILTSSIVVPLTAGVPWNVYTLKDTSHPTLTVALVVIALALIVTVHGVIYACLPFWLNSEEQEGNQHHHNMSLKIVGSASDKYDKTKDPDFKEEPV